MLKGYIFKEQIFQNEICALIFNEYLNNSNGIFGNYKNAMAVTSSGSNLTIASGVGIIQGRAIGEDSSTTIDAGTDSMYCKLVVEIDLDKVNTSSDFLQASYQIIKSASAYPALTQDNIIGTNSGKFQYELARFRTTSGGIVEFQDMRTFIDIPTMYEQVADMVQSTIDSIEDTSAFAFKTDLQGTVLFEGTATNTHVSLDDDLSNYDYFEVYGYTTDPYYKQAFCKKYSVDNALNNFIDITQSRPTMHGVLLYTTILHVFERQIKMDSQAGPWVKAIEMQLGGNVAKTDVYSQTITKVIGYKY